MQDPNSYNNIYKQNTNYCKSNNCNNKIKATSIDKVTVRKQFNTSTGQTWKANYIKIAHTVNKLDELSMYGRHNYDTAWDEDTQKLYICDRGIWTEFKYASIKAKDYVVNNKPEYYKTGLVVSWDDIRFVAPRPEHFHMPANQVYPYLSTYDNGNNYMGKLVYINDTLWFYAGKNLWWSADVLQHYISEEEDLINQDNTLIPW